ncbi:MAG: hypothetical protein V4694_02920 [Pseudomonadota bacterium]
MSKPEELRKIHDLSTDDGLKARYDELLETEKNKRPAWEKQSLLQKLDARLDGAASTYMAVGSAVLALTPYFLITPLTLAASANAAKHYDEKTNPEKYYEVKALEKLAIESGKLKAPGQKHRIFGADILGTGVGSYGDKLNAVINGDKSNKGLAEIVGLDPAKNPNLNYTHPSESLDKLNSVTRGVNRLATKTSSLFKDKEGKFSVLEPFKKFRNLSQRIAKNITNFLGFSKEEEKEPEQNLTQKILNFFKELFGIKRNNGGVDSSTTLTYNPIKTILPSPVQTSAIVTTETPEVENKTPEVEKSIPSNSPAPVQALAIVGNETLKKGTSKNTWVDRIENKINRKGPDIRSAG